MTAERDDGENKARDDGQEKKPEPSVSSVAETSMMVLFGICVVFGILVVFVLGTCFLM